MHSHNDIETTIQSGGHVFSSRKTTSRGAKRFVFVVCLIIIGLVALSTLRERDVELSQTDEALSNMAMALAQHADQTFNEADIVLQGIVERLRVDGHDEKGLRRTHEVMVMRVRELAQLNGLFVYDEFGNWVVNSQPTLDTRLNNSDRDYFQYHRDHSSLAPHIGKPIQSRSNGSWILTISRRINKTDGSFGGVVLATINLSFFERFYERFNLGEQGAIMLGTMSGTVLFRRPILNDSIGKSLDKSPLFQQYVRHRTEGTVEIRSTMDGVLRVNSFRRLEQHPLFIIVAQSKDYILSSWYNHVLYRSLGVSVLVVLLVFGGRKLVIQIKITEAIQDEAVAARHRAEELNTVLQRQALLDGLTGLANRRKFDDAIRQEIARVNRHHEPVTLLMLDVDHFKKFNDRYGHLEGDECLRRIGRALNAAVQRPGDVAARYGGEEFALVLPGCDRVGAQMVAKRIRAAILAMNIAHEDSPHHVVSVSIGAATLTWPACTWSLPKDMIKAADEALYVAKQRGRNTVAAAAIPLEEARRA